MESLQKIHKEKVDAKMMSESRKTCNTKNLPARLQADQPLFQAFHRFQAFSTCPSLPDTLAISKDPGSPWRFAPMQCPSGCVKMFPHIQAPLWLCSTKNASKRPVRDSQRFHGTGFCDAKRWVCFCQSNTTKIMLFACVLLLLSHFSRVQLCVTP